MKHHLASNGKQYPYLNQCHHCGNIWVTKSYIRCPCCDSANIYFVPFYNHKLFHIKWLENNGFPYLKKLLEVNIDVE